MDRNKIAALIVIYNPCIKDIIDKVNKITELFTKVIIIDNSDNGKSVNNYFLSANVRYFCFGENKGIASAINYGCKIALEEGFEWCVTLDQDSVLPNNYVESIIEFIDKRIENVGIVAPQYISAENKNNVRKKDGFLYVNEVISSGSCINLSAFNSIGGQKEDFFIDCVDFEFCWKLRSAGYKIIQLQNVILLHALGNNGREIKFVNKHIAYITNHSPIRKYYMTRNSLYLAQMYKNVFPDDVRKRRNKILKLFFKSLVFEANKIKAIKAIFYGIIDYKRNVRGKCGHLL